ncbi:MAG: aminoacyl-histidine dipeptidase, partial [Clostridium sp.]
MKILQNIEPKLVFSYFEEISQIPRGSGNEKAISDYLVKFAKDLNLEVIQDEVLNVIIKKPGTKG